MPNDPPSPKKNGWLKPLLASLAIYCTCGALSGVAAGVIGWAMSQSYRQGEFYFRCVEVSRWIIDAEEIRDSLVPGIVLGIAIGFAMCGLALYWPALHHPLRAALLCASVGGSISLIVVTCIMFADDGLHSAKVVRLLLHVAGHIILGAVYGFLLAVFVRLGERWLGRKAPPE